MPSIDTRSAMFPDFLDFLFENRMLYRSSQDIRAQGNKTLQAGAQHSILSIRGTLPLRLPSWFFKQLLERVSNSMLDA